MSPVIVILAGGSAKRLKELSENFTPKQFLIPNFSEDSFLQSTIQRARTLTSPDRIIVIGNVINKSILEKQIPNNITLLLEQDSNNTAIAVYLASVYAFRQFGNCPIFIWPSDHHIKNQTDFINEIKYAYERRAADKINIFGVNTSIYSKDFGYIKCQDSQVLKFIEKPTKEEYLEHLQDNAYINSGLFLGEAELFIAELSTHKINAETKFQILSPNTSLVVDFEIEKEKQISFDKLILQNSTNLHMHEISNFWLDIGNWLNLWQLGDEEKLTFKLESEAKRVESEDYIFDLKNDILNIYKKEKSDELT